MHRSPSRSATRMRTRNCSSRRLPQPSCWVRVVRDPIVRAVCVVAALGGIGLAAVSGSEAVVVLLIGLVPLAVVVGWRGFGRRSLIWFGALVVAAVLFTTATGAAFRPGGDQSALVSGAMSAFSVRRVVLWHDAWVLAIDHPLTGVGPGRFRLESPTALADADASWAHQEFLQMGAEGGFPAMMLLVLLFLWGLARLGAGPRFGAPALIAAVAITALGLHASIDYVLHFPQIPVATAVLLGAAVTWTERTEAS